MSFSGLNELTSKPKVGIVQTTAMMIAIADAQGELKASFIFWLPLVIFKPWSLVFLAITAPFYRA
jgi:hypothetical protein